MTRTNLAYHLKNIAHYYGSTKVMDIEELKIEKGSITGLLGPNGSGKSTLLKLLAFAMKPSAGDIFYNGQKEQCFSPTVRYRVTLMTQTPYLLKRTVFDNIAYGLKIRKDTADLKLRIKKALADVGLGYERFAHRRWHQLSGGEAQRVAMAARMILKPEVLLLDEPVASVDAKSARLIRAASLKAREKWGATLVVASHDLQWLYSISDTQLSIFNGTVFTSGIENIIPGPFAAGPANSPSSFLAKTLEDGQTIFLKAPQKESDTAIIRKNQITLKTAEASGELKKQTINRLSGHVVSLLLEKKTRHIMTTVSAGEMGFVLRLSAEEISRRDIYPGKAVCLSFSPGDVEWI